MTSKISDNKSAINDQLGKLESIVEWFETQAQVDVEAGLEKVKEGAVLIKELKTKLKKVENEFKEIKESLDEEDA